MKSILYATAFALLGAPSAAANSVYFEFLNYDLDETFDVNFRIRSGSSTGLATYNIALTGLDDTPLDPSTFVWQENVLSNLGTDFVVRGFTAGLLEGPVGTDAYSAANSQFQQNPIFGVGQVPIFVDAFDGAPNNFDIDLGVPVLLGTLTIPGANSLSSAELRSLFAPNAALFVGTDPGVVVTPDEISFCVYCVPEPSTTLLAALAAAGFAARRR